jgi:hypothetical protein
VGLQRLQQREAREAAAEARVLQFYIWMRQQYRDRQSQLQQAQEQIVLAH